MAAPGNRERSSSATSSTVPCATTCVGRVRTLDHGHLSPNQLGSDGLACQLVVVPSPHTNTVRTKLNADDRPPSSPKCRTSVGWDLQRVLNQRISRFRVKRTLKWLTGIAIAGREEFGLFCCACSSPTPPSATAKTGSPAVT